MASCTFTSFLSRSNIFLSEKVSGEWQNDIIFLVTLTHLRNHLMKSSVTLPKFCLYLLFSMVLFLVIGCASIRREDNPHACRINNPVYDTLFVYLNDYKDGWVNIQIQTNQVRYAAKEQVVNGRAWFDIRHFPSGHYTVWIDYGPYSITRRFWHDLRY